MEAFIIDKGYDLALYPVVLSLASLFIKVGYIVLELSLVAENVKFSQSDSYPAA